MPRLFSQLIFVLADPAPDGLIDSDSGQFSDPPPGERHDGMARGETANSANRGGGMRACHAQGAAPKRHPRSILPLH